MFRKNQFSLAYLLALLTAVAAVAGLVRWLSVTGSGERLLDWFGLLVAILVGGMILSVRIWFLLYAVRVTLYWPQASARVVRYSIHRHEGQAFYHPVVRFCTADGRRTTAISNSGWWLPTWTRGTVVSLPYHPHDPRWVEIVSPRNLGGFLPALALLGVLAWLGFLMFVFPRFLGFAAHL
jgi:hypothetical protein